MTGCLNVAPLAILIFFKLAAHCTNHSRCCCSVHRPQQLFEIILLLFAVTWLSYMQPADSIKLSSFNICCCNLWSPLDLLIGWDIYVDSKVSLKYKRI
ncbi:hypothetical protein V6Z11_A11G076600 [Gossypium hirsutum]